MLRGYKFRQNLARIAGILHEDKCTFMTISLSFSWNGKSFRQKL